MLLNDHLPETRIRRSAVLLWRVLLWSAQVHTAALKRRHARRILNMIREDRELEELQCARRCVPDVTYRSGGALTPYQTLDPPLHFKDVEGRRDASQRRLLSCAAMHHGICSFAFATSLETPQRAFAILGAVHFYCRLVSYIHSDVFY